MGDTKTLFKGENLLLQLDTYEGRQPLLFLGSLEPNSDWFTFDLEKAKAFRGALDKGINMMEESK